MHEDAAAGLAWVALARPPVDGRGQGEHGEGKEGGGRLPSQEAARWEREGEGGGGERGMQSVRWECDSTGHGGDSRRMEEGLRERGAGREGEGEGRRQQGEGDDWQERGVQVQSKLGRKRPEPEEARVERAESGPLEPGRRLGRWAERVPCEVVQSRKTGVPSELRSQVDLFACPFDLG